MALLIIVLGGWHSSILRLSLILASLIGVWHVQYIYRDHLSDYDTLWKNIPHRSTLAITGEISDLLYTTELSHVYRLRIDKIATTSTAGSTGNSTGQILMSGDQRDIGIFVDIPSNLTVSVGDTISYRGTISTSISWPLEGFSRYMWYHRAYGKSRANVFQRGPSGPSSPLQQIQKWSEKTLFHGFPKDIAGIILGMSIGNIELLDPETKSTFTQAGIIHILVVSGSNIAFVILIISKLLSYIPIRSTIKHMIIVGFVLLYGSLVGWEVPVIRAICMGLIAYGAIASGVRASSIAILFGVGIGLLLYNPLALAYDAGFGLSFAATLSILIFYQPIYQFLQRIHIPRWISETIGVTLAATIGSSIAILYHFGTVSLIGIIPNIMIGWILGWILFSSVLYLVFASLGSTMLIYIWGWVIYLPISYITLVGAYFGRFGVTELDGALAKRIALTLCALTLIMIIWRESKKLLETK